MMGMALRVLMKAAPVSAFWANKIIASMILQTTRMDPFMEGEGEVVSMGFFGVLLRKKNPPARDLAFGLLR